MQASGQYHGIINVYKEQGFTSFDAVAALRGILHQKKIGHTGTLDPMATGVLPVCLGKGTGVVELLTDWDKEYVGELLPGLTTDTLDVTGERTGGDPGMASSLPPERIREAVLSFLGGYDQIPPMYSALKVDGQRLYDLARKGQEVERKPRKVVIRELEILSEGTEVLPGDGGESFTVPTLRFRVLCSKGTYIRSLCDDIGKKLGCGGCMKSLERTAVGPFTLENAKRLKEIEALRDAALARGEIRHRDNRGNDCPPGEALGILPIDLLFRDLPEAKALPAGEKLLQNGNVVKASLLRDCPKEERLRIYLEDDTFVGIFRRSGELYKPEKIFLI
ncbi:MAG: tRNA pseudouridine(55) synthase TruB [Lachnospiraceae bacterium]|nr:tRNA pseudouridine(55) synthase TruB [Lachnospiraceae bacterium]